MAESTTQSTTQKVAPKAPAPTTQGSPPAPKAEDTGYAIPEALTKLGSAAVNDFKKLSADSQKAVSEYYTALKNGETVKSVKDFMESKGHQFSDEVQKFLGTDAGKAISNTAHEVADGAKGNSWGIGGLVAGLLGGLLFGGGDPLMMILFALLGGAAASIFGDKEHGLVGGMLQGTAVGKFLGIPEKTVVSNAAAQAPVLSLDADGKPVEEGKSALKLAGKFNEKKDEYIVSEIEVLTEGAFKKVPLENPVTFAVTKDKGGKDIVDMESPANKTALKNIYTLEEARLDKDKAKEVALQNAVDKAEGTDIEKIKVLQDAIGATGDKKGAELTDLKALQAKALGTVQDMKGEEAALIKGLPILKNAGEAVAPTK